MQAYSKLIQKKKILNPMVPGDESKSAKKFAAILPKEPDSNIFAFESLSYEASGDSGQLELSGRGLPGSRVRLFEGQREMGEVVANDKGIWSFSKRGVIKLGSYVFRAGHVLKSGRIASEARMQYDYVGATKIAEKTKTGIDKTRIGKAGISKPETRKKNVKLDGMGQKGKQQASPSIKTARAGSSVNGAIDKARVQKDPPASQNVSSGEGADHSLPPSTIARQAKPIAQAVVGVAKQKRSLRKNTPRKKVRKRHRRRSARKAVVGRYNLSRRNRARYLAKRKKYPRSKRTPARVRVRKGTTLWGYSEHYYGSGKLYPRIRRANRRTIKNSNRLYVGQRIRVPRLRNKRRNKLRSKR